MGARARAAAARRRRGPCFLLVCFLLWRDSLRARTSCRVDISIASILAREKLAPALPTSFLWGCKLHGANVLVISLVYRLCRAGLVDDDPIGASACCCGRPRGACLVCVCECGEHHPVGHACRVEAKNTSEDEQMLQRSTRSRSRSRDRSRPRGRHAARYLRH